MAGIDLGKALIDHADRMWSAEREIASRYAERVRHLVTVSTGLLAAATAGVLAFLRLAPTQGLGWGFRLLIVAVVGWNLLWMARSLVTSIIVVLRLPLPARRGPSAAGERAASATEGAWENGPPTASWLLSPPAGFLDQVKPALDPSVFILATRVMSATEDLRLRNIREKNRIVQGEADLAKGILRTFWLFVTLALGSVVLFVV